MTKQDVLYNQEDSIGIITLNRTERLNALTHEMLHRINSVREPVFKGKWEHLSLRECVGLTD